MMRRKLIARQTPRRLFLQSAALTGLSLGCAGIILAEDGPNSSLYSGRMGSFTPVRQTQQYGAAQAYGAGPPQSTSWYETPLPPPKEVRVHDIITIRVDLGARMSSDVQFQRRRTAQYNAILNDWVFLDGLRALKKDPQRDGDQQVQGNLNHLDRVTGDLETTESIKFELAAEVTAILPNGNLVLEAHRTVRNNEELWMHSLTGICRREDIGPGNLLLSKDILHLNVEKKETGHMRDSYKRGWFWRWFDTVLNPF
jgi:flagellar L-ring protein precursor FlgH